MTEWLDPVKHEETCGTAAGYQQISRARRSARAAGVKERDLPRYDSACKAAWARYIRTRRGPYVHREPARHGTVRGYRHHTYTRNRLRRKGVPEAQLPPICDACRTAHMAARNVDSLLRILAG